MEELTEVSVSAYYRLEALKIVAALAPTFTVEVPIPTMFELADLLKIYIESGIIPDEGF